MISFHNWLVGVSYSYMFVLFSHEHHTTRSLFYGLLQAQLAVQVSEVHELRKNVQR